MEKKNNNILVAILILLIVLLGGYIVYDKVLMSNNNELEESNKQNEEMENSKDEEVQYYDYTEISNVLNEKLSGFIKFRGWDKHNTDLLSTADLRLSLIDYLFMQANDILTYDNGVVQPFPYVSYEKYSSKYNEIYGENYSLENDLSNVSSGAIANKNNEYVGSNNISWNGTWGTSGLSYTLSAQNISYNKSNDVYTLKGIYTKTDEGNNSSSNGTFEITYTKKDAVKSLKSIVLSESN